MRHIRGFTFDKSHMRLNFTKEDECMMMQIQKMLHKRMTAVEKNLRMHNDEVK